MTWRPSRTEPPVQPSYTHRAKVIVVGDAAVGKTSLVVRYVKGIFNPSYIITLGVNFFLQDIVVHDKILRMQIWDTAGQERFGPIRERYFLGARGAVLVYDKSNPNSFANLINWINEVHRICGAIPMVMVGNKADLIESVSTEHAQQFAANYGLVCVETSAKTGMNTVKPFFLLAPKILDALEQ